jgi:hypothetical protein
MVDQDADRVEAVARVICEASDIGAATYEATKGKPSRENYSNMARAAIAAYETHLAKQGMGIMPRDPTREMIWAAERRGDEHGVGGISDSDAEDIWENMWLAYLAGNEQGEKAGNMTATELNERSAEMGRMFGEAHERMQAALLAPIIAWAEAVVDAAVDRAMGAPREGDRIVTCTDFHDAIPEFLYIATGGRCESCLAVARAKVRAEKEANRMSTSSFSKVTLCKAAPPIDDYKWPTTSPDDWCGKFEARL